MRVRGTLLLLAAAVLPGLAQCARPGDAARAPARHVVEIRGFQFVPARLEIAAGDTVVWINHDVVPHTATSIERAWHTGTIAAGDSASLVVEAGPGEYVCALHPSMRGVLMIP